MEISRKSSDKIANGGIIAAAMVVGIHVCNGGAVGSLIWWWDCLLHYGICLVAVPFFFVCSGYFLCRHYVACEKEVERIGGGEQRMILSLSEVWRAEMWKRVKSLLVPFVIWSVIGICLYEVLQVRAMANLMHGRNLFTNFPDEWRFWARGLGVYPYSYPLVVPLWYVRSLLIFAVLSPVLFKLMEKLGGRKYAWFCISFGRCWVQALRRGIVCILSVVIAYPFKGSSSSRLVVPWLAQKWVAS